MTTQVDEIGVRLLDDAYLGWRAPLSECERALHGWLQASLRGREANPMSSTCYVVDPDVDAVDVRAGQLEHLATYGLADGVGDALKDRPEGNDELDRQVHAVGRRGVMLLHPG